ncbi:alpha/beta hydrolase [Paractinoplanes atraurantiacus]|uniref:Pimeloyl-ACP methyl ester carboxylesterase n=1 Tax=Paractinoplanes atraurantiacus TaxID=1036182 RepID=A0A285IC41_9ACTN|nr:alpha/beta hydrolase [Actinoplanes atraurantiacus]SNY45530.1 Pimeloyl-ACP methyl ester carboxylesterase [Actinoplanes atraurantiacus]
MHTLLAFVLVAAGPVPVTTSPGLDWHDCGTEKGTQCATLTVPVDWSRPGGATIGIAVAKRAADDQDRKVGTLVFGPGGPGDSGVDRVVNGSSRFKNLRARFDIVSFDPRGVAGSAAVDCEPVPMDPVLTSPGQFEERLRLNRELWADCARRAGPVWQHADTLSTVRDVEALRKALGEKQLTFHGSSYGTLLGQEYASRHPGRVRAMVLESVTDHSSRSTASFLSAQAWAFEDAYGDFIATCPECAAPWQRLFADPGRAGMTPFDLVAITHKLLKDGEYERLAAQIKAFDGGAQGQHVRNLGVVIPAFCSDWSLPVRSYAEYQRILRQAERVAPNTHFPAQVFALTMCLGWPRVTNPQHDLDVRTRVPLLLLNARHDPATGLNWARNVERQLGQRGVLVTYEGTGHGSYTLSQCMRDITDDYLINLTVPAKGVSCPR